MLIFGLGIAALEEHVHTNPHLLQPSPPSTHKRSATEPKSGRPRWTCAAVNMTSSFPSAVVLEESLRASFTWPKICAQAFAGVIAIIIWRKYSYSISDVPGPFLASFTRLWHLVRIFVGDQNLRMMELHDKHGVSTPKWHWLMACLVVDPFISGHFVRIADDEVSVSHPDAVRKLLLAPVPKV